MYNNIGLRSKNLARQYSFWLLVKGIKRMILKINI